MTNLQDEVTRKGWRTSNPPAPDATPIGFWAAITARIRRSSTPHVMALTVLGMALGLGVDVSIANALGATVEADALVIALSLPLIIDTVAREGMRFSLIPVFSARRLSLSRKDYEGYISGLLNVALLAGVVVAALLLLFAPVLVRLLAPGFSTAAQTVATTLLRMCAPMALLTFGISVQASILNSQARFTTAALRNAVAPGLVVVGILLQGGRGALADWIAGCYALGFGAYFLILFYDIRRTGHRHQWVALTSPSQLREVIGALVLPSTGLGVRQVSRLIERTLASTMAVGGVVTYYFAYRSFTAMQTIIGSSIATTGINRMIVHSTAGDRGEMARSIRAAGLRSLALSSPAALAAVFLSDGLVRVLYLHGSFSADAAAQTASVLVCLGFGLPFSCLLPVLQSGLHAQRAYSAVLRNTATMAIVNVVLAVLFSRPWGLSGIGVAVSVTALLSAGNLVFLLARTGVRILPRGRVPVFRDR